MSSLKKFLSSLRGGRLLVAIVATIAGAFAVGTRHEIQYRWIYGRPEFRLVRRSEPVEYLVPVIELVENEVVYDLRPGFGELYDQDAESAYWQAYDELAGRLDEAKAELVEQNPEQKVIQWKQIILSGLFVELDLHNNSQLQNLNALRELPIVRLDLSGTAVADLRSLMSMPLDRLILANCPSLDDLSPLAQCAVLRTVIIPDHVDLKTGRTQVGSSVRIFAHDCPKARLHIALKDCNANYEYHGAITTGNDDSGRGPDTGPVVKFTSQVKYYTREGIGDYTPLLACAELKTLNGIAVDDPPAVLRGWLTDTEIRHRYTELQNRFKQAVCPWFKLEADRLLAALDRPDASWVEDLIESNRFDEAETTVKRMLAQCETRDQKTRFGLLFARLCRLRGQLSAAEKVLVAVSRGEPEEVWSARIILERTRVLMAKGDRAGAVNALNKLLELQGKGVSIGRDAQVLAESLGAGKVADRLRRSGRSMPGCVLAFDFGGLSGGGADQNLTVPDVSGARNHGAATGAVVVRDQFGDALQFSGADSYVDCGHRQDLDLAEALTVAAWAKSEDGRGEGHIVNRGGGWEDPGYSLFLHDGRLRIELQRDGEKIVLDNPAPATVGEWHHYAMTWDTVTQTVTAYIDGKAAPKIATFAGPIGKPDQNLNLGRNERHTNGENARYNFTGLIDEVTIFNRALSAAGILRLSRLRVAGSVSPEDAVKTVMARLRTSNPQQKTLHFEHAWDSHGHSCLDLSGNAELRDLRPLGALPIDRLDLTGAAIDDLNVLAGCSVERVILHECRNLNDLQPLTEWPELRFVIAPVHVELGPIPMALPKVTVLHNTPDARLHLALKDKNPNYDYHGRFVVREEQVSEVHLFGWTISDISPLRGLPLKRFSHRGTVLRDIEPLLECDKLERVSCLALRNPLRDPYFDDETYAQARKRAEHMLEQAARSSAPWFRQQAEKLRQSLAGFDRRWVDKSLARKEYAEAAKALVLMGAFCRNATEKAELALLTVRVSLATGKPKQALPLLDRVLADTDMPVSWRRELLVASAQVQTAVGDPGHAATVLQQLVDCTPAEVFLPASCQH